MHCQLPDEDHPVAGMTGVIRKRSPSGLCKSHVEPAKIPTRQKTAHVQQRLPLEAESRSLSCEPLVLAVVAAAADHRPVIRPTTARPHPVHHHKGRAPHPRVPHQHLSLAASVVFQSDGRDKRQRRWQYWLAVLKILLVEPLRPPMHDCWKAKITKKPPHRATSTYTIWTPLRRPCEAEAPPHRSRCGLQPAASIDNKKLQHDPVQQVTPSRTAGTWAELCTTPCPRKRDDSCQAQLSVLALRESAVDHNVHVSCMEGIDVVDG